MRKVRRITLLALLARASFLLALDPQTVVVEDATTNNQGVVIVHVTNGGTDAKHYTLACNAELNSCFVPDKGTTYILQDAPEAVYHRQNVALFKRKNEIAGVYWLNGVQ